MALITIEFPAGTSGPQTPKRVLDQHTHLIRRTLAAAIDYGLLLAILKYVIVFFGTESADGRFTLSLFSLLPLFALFLLCFATAESLFGRTAGKWLFDLIVVDAAGRRPSFFQSLKRHLLDPVDFIGTFLPAVAIVKISQSHQRLGDMTAGTWVVSSIPPCSVLRDPPKNAA